MTTTGDTHVPTVAMVKEMVTLLVTKRLHYIIFLYLHFNDSNETFTSNLYSLLKVFISQNEVDNVLLLDRKCARLT